VGTARASGDTFLGLSTGLCRECHQLVQVRYLADGDLVVLQRLCPSHGESRTVVAESLEWYLANVCTPGSPTPPARPVPRTGPCPTSCGPCTLHSQRCNLPVLSITNACDMRCPKCFTFNRSDQIYTMSEDEFEMQLDFVLASCGSVDLINVTGGEPTLHPGLFDLLARARRSGIGRITVNTNGLRLAGDPELAARLADLGVYVVLSLDTLDPSHSLAMHGRDVSSFKLRALGHLSDHGVPTTLLMTLAAGVNDTALGEILDLALKTPNVRSLTIQTMTYTGQGGATFAPRRHLPIDGVQRLVAEVSGGRIPVSAFMPLPTAHPLCYAVTYLLHGTDGAAYPITSVLDRACLDRHLAKGYLLHPDESLAQDLRTAIDRLWSEGTEPGLLAALKNLIATAYPPGPPLTVHERQRRAERLATTIIIHAHMDEDTYDVGRAMRCPDQVPIDATRMVGACNYNLFHRRNDPRFWVET